MGRTIKSLGTSGITGFKHCHIAGHRTKYCFDSVFMKKKKTVFAFLCTDSNFQLI